MWILFVRQEQQLLRKERAETCTIVEPYRSVCFFRGSVAAAWILHDSDADSQGKLKDVSKDDYGNESLLTEVELNDLLSGVENLVQSREKKSLRERIRSAPHLVISVI